MSKEILYTLSFEKPYTHYCEVGINVQNFSEENLTFVMPVWTPGSYLVREFSKNVEGVYAVDSEGKKLDVRKINKNSWTVNARGSKQIKFGYRVYCNELTVRTPEVNSSHAFISGAGVFMFVEGFEQSKCILKINQPAEWKKISTGLEREGNLLTARNYDELIDSPVEIGNQEILEFEITGVKHFICLSGRGNYDAEVVTADIKKIAEEEIKLFGDIPYIHYTFIIHLVEKGGGGLEHHNSFVAQFGRWNFKEDKLYKKFLGLVSHEFFHLWNVKRIRPVELGPFDYLKENYTESLWISEGWTNFYDNLFLRRSGILDEKEYFEFVDIEINDVMRFKGRFSQSLAESSFDTWIKFYRRDENYNNAQVSYYTKGSLVAMVLNVEIIMATNAEKSLDDILKTMYDDYKRTGAGFTNERVKEICEGFCAKSFGEFWEKYVYGTNELPLNDYLNACGLELRNENEEKFTSLDIEVKNDDGKLIVSKVFAGGSAYESGINARDELIAIDNIRISNDSLDKVVNNYEAGDTAEALVSRSGLLKKIEIKFLRPLPKFKITELEKKTTEQQKNLSAWLGIN